MSNLLDRETDELLQLAEDEKFGKQQQESLKALVRHTFILIAAPSSRSNAIAQAVWWRILGFGL